MPKVRGKARGTPQSRIEYRPTLTCGPGVPQPFPQLICNSVSQDCQGKDSERLTIAPHVLRMPSDHSKGDSAFTAAILAEKSAVQPSLVIDALFKLQIRNLRQNLPSSTYFTCINRAMPRRSPLVQKTKLSQAYRLKSSSLAQSGISAPWILSPAF